MTVPTVTSGEGTAWRWWLAWLILVVAFAVGPVSPTGVDAAPPAGPCRNLRAKSDVMKAVVFQWFIRSAAV